MREKTIKMPEEKTRSEHFDEAFKILLVIMSVCFSGTITFLKGILEPRFFSYTVGMFITTIALWTFANLYGGKYEYFIKTTA